MDQSKVSFKDINISSDVLKALDEMGFKNPTEIQEKAINVLKNTNRNFVGQAQTGTGKTAAFVVPLLDKIDFKNDSVQAIILAPTRELASQVENEITKIGKYTPVRSTCVYGGTGYEGQINSLQKNKPQIVVGTPGRVIDLLKKKILKLDKTKFCILDEADEMLQMGFIEDVQIVLKRLRGQKQLMMFSATMPKAILNIVDKSFGDHELVKIEKKSLSNDNIEQRYFVVRDKHMKEGLSRLIDDAQDLYGIVFCRTKIETKEVGDDLKKRGLSVEVLNGDMGQEQRDLAMRNFKKKKVNIMVCTDVAARGIDVNNLTHVFNFGLPRDNESYVHRIGRTGRAGMKGKAYTIVGTNSAYAVGNIATHINQKILKTELPTVADLKRNLVKKEIENASFIISAIKDKGDDFKTEESFDLVQQEFGELSKDELMKLMFVWKFNKPMRHLNNLADIETASAKSKKPKSGRRKPRPVNSKPKRRR